MSCIPKPGTLSRLIIPKATGFDRSVSSYRKTRLQILSKWEVNWKVTLNGLAAIPLGQVSKETVKMYKETLNRNAKQVFQQLNELKNEKRYWKARALKAERNLKVFAPGKPLQAINNYNEANNNA